MIMMLGLVQLNQPFVAISFVVRLVRRFYLIDSFLGGRIALRSEDAATFNLLIC